MIMMQQEDHNEKQEKKQVQLKTKDDAPDAADADADHHEE
jgi:hypothetical protein